jgi:hypothetical protein
MLGLFLGNERDGDFEAVGSLHHLATESLEEAGQVIEKRDVTRHDTHWPIFVPAPTGPKLLAYTVLAGEGLVSTGHLAPGVVAV